MLGWDYSDFAIGYRSNFWHGSCFKPTRVNKPTPAMKPIYLFSVMLLVSGLCGASTTQSIQSMQGAIQRFIQSALPANGHYQINNAQIDDRLQLPACDQDLNIFAQSGRIKPGRNTIGISCPGTDNWTIYSTVLIKSFKNVLVLTKQLNRNDRITAEHLRTETRDIASLQQGYIIDPADVVNKQATRSVAAGSALNRTHYTEPTLIKRGDQVSIQSGKAGLLITTKGVAMMNGTKGQQIRVKNVTSRRVIKATVVNPGVVTVYF